MLDIAEYIHQSDLIENIDSKAFDMQSMTAWNWIKQKDKLTLDNICKLQKRITLLQEDLLPTQRGYTRSMSKVNVMVGGKFAPSWWLVDGLLSNWVLDMQDYWETLNPIEMHVRFEHIHPFADGNGRTGRMLLWYHELKLGRTPTLFLNNEKHEKYYVLFK